MMADYTPTVQDRLRQYRYLLREIKLLEEDLLELDTKTQRLTTQLTGMPRGSAGTDRLTDIIARKIELREIISERAAWLHQERVELERYVSRVPDSLLRQILALRYFRGLSWTAVGLALGGGNTGNSAKQIVRRWFGQGCG